MRLIFTFQCASSRKGRERSSIASVLEPWRAACDEPDDRETSSLVTRRCWKAADECPKDRHGSRGYPGIRSAWPSVSDVLG